MAKDTTRLAIIKEGAKLIHARGYNNTGLSDILKAARVPKGSFYFYFKNKEDFGVAVVDYYINLLQGIGQAFLNEQGIPPLERLSRFMDIFQKHFESMDLRCGCPIGNLSQEMSDHSELFREKISEAYSLMTDAIETCLKEAQSQGDLPSAMDTTKTAQFIFNSWEGAIIHMKLVKSVEPLKVCKHMMFEYILKISPRENTIVR